MDAVAGRASNLVQGRKAKSPSPGRQRNLPGNMKISFRRSPTPLREVVPYRPSDPVQELRNLHQQVASRPPQSPERHYPATQLQAGETSDAESIPPQARQVQLHRGKGSQAKGRGKNTFVPWKQWRMTPKRKGKGAKRGKGK